MEWKPRSDRLRDVLESNDVIRFILLAALVLIAHSNFLFPSFIENPDESLIYPLLEKISTPLEYIKKLAEFETLDFQPVRDLTLYIDILVLRNFGVIISIFLNCLIWIWAMWQVLRIIEERYEFNRLHTFLVVGCFSVYPIYAQSINWGIARKHLLAFAFSIAATRYFFLWLKGLAKERHILIFYTLSVLSVPVSMLWPLWARMTIFFTKSPRRQKNSLKLIVSLYLVMLLIIGINWAYYNTSYTFLQTYQQKSYYNDYFMILLNVGHQIKQVLFPYNLSYYYGFDGFSLAGAVLLLIFLIWLFFKKRNEGEIWIWVIYSGVHLVVLQNTPLAYFDTYVLQTSLGLFFIIFLLVRNYFKRLIPVLSILLVFWTAFTLSVNPTWGDSVKFFKKSFESQQSCGNAIGYGAAKYLKMEKLPDDLYDYIQVNECLMKDPNDSPFLAMRKLNFEALQLLIEEDIDFQYREKRLIELSLNQIFEMSIYMIFLVKNDRAQELERLSSNVIEKVKRSDIQLEFHPIFLAHVPKYCEQKKLPNCLRLCWMREKNTSSK